MIAKHWLFLSCIAWFFLLGAQYHPQDPSFISVPPPGAALQGVVTIRGTSDLPDFLSSEVAFAYASGAVENWFLLQQAQTPVKDATLALWDTTTIADGNYRIRLQVFLTDGRTVTYEVGGLRVRNYTALETNTPTAISVSNLPLATLTPIPPSPTPRHTPTAFSPNPAQVHPTDLNRGMLVGIGATTFLFLLLALYQAAHHQSRSS